MFPHLHHRHTAIIPRWCNYFKHPSHDAPCLITFHSDTTSWSSHPCSCPPFPRHHRTMVTLLRPRPHRHSLFWSSPIFSVAPGTINLVPPDKGSSPIWSPIPVRPQMTPHGQPGYEHPSCPCSGPQLFFSLCSWFHCFPVSNVGRPVVTLVRVGWRVANSCSRPLQHAQHHISQQTTGRYPHSEYDSHTGTIHLLPHSHYRGKSWPPFTSPICYPCHRPCMSH
jgi:hypothetical protein